jgi:hypothetical protein
MSFSKIVTVLVLIGFLAYADNVPTIHQVYQAAETGDLNGAHQMIEQVLKAHPESAKAHYVDAEILARQGNLSDAKNELTKAEQLEPGLPFAKPQAVQSLKQHIAVSSNVQMSTSHMGTTQQNNHSTPWTMILLGVGALIVIWLVIRSFMSRNTNQYSSGNNGGSGSYPNPNNPYNRSTPGFGGGQPYPPQSSGIGGGIMSSLATGAAAGAGFVAGEELMHHFMGAPSSNANSNNVNNTPIVNEEPSYDMGGSDFGLKDDSSWDDSSSDTMSDSGDDTW